MSRSRSNRSNRTERRFTATGPGPGSQSAADVELASFGFRPAEIWADRVTGLWQGVGRPARGEGWKLHLSARVDHFGSLLARAIPLLRGHGCAFKVASSGKVAWRLNSGELGASQVGKLLTVYPADDHAAGQLAGPLTKALDGLPGPVVDEELRLSPSAPVYARYGAFFPGPGQAEAAVHDIRGKRVLDDRSRPRHRELGRVPPFARYTEPIQPRIYADRFVPVGRVQRTFTSVLLAAVDVTTAQPCLLKVRKRHTAIDSRGHDAATRLRREHSHLAALAGSVRVPAPLGLIEDADEVVLALQMIQGRTLASQIAGTLRMPDYGKVARSLLRDLLETLSAAWAGGLTLVDVSPGNILVATDGPLWMIDLEFAVAEGEPAARGCGTPGCTAPGVLAGGHPTRADDLYSLAALAFFLATGMDPSRAAAPAEMLADVTFLPPGWRSLIQLLQSAATPATGTDLADIWLAVGALEPGAPYDH